MLEQIILDTFEKKFSSNVYAPQIVLTARLNYFALLRSKQLPPIDIPNLTMSDETASLLMSKLFFQYKIINGLIKNRIDQAENFHLFFQSIKRLPSELRKINQDLFVTIYINFLGNMLSQERDFTHPQLKLVLEEIIKTMADTTKLEQYKYHPDTQNTYKYFLSLLIKNRRLSHTLNFSKEYDEAIIKIMNACKVWGINLHNIALMLSTEHDLDGLENPIIDDIKRLYNEISATTQSIKNKYPFLQFKNLQLPDEVKKNISLIVNEKFEVSSDKTFMATSHFFDFAYPEIQNRLEFDENLWLNQMSVALNEKLDVLDCHWLFYLCIHRINNENAMITLQLALKLIDQKGINPENLTLIFEKISERNISSEIYKSFFEELNANYLLPPDKKKKNLSNNTGEIINQFLNFIAENNVYVENAFINDLKVFIDKMDLKKKLAASLLNLFGIINTNPYFTKENIQQIIANPDSSLPGLILYNKRMTEFFKHFKKVNDFSQERYQQSFDDFNVKYFVKLQQLKFILGDNFVDFIKHFMITSILPLERFLNSYTLLPKEYEKNLAEKFLCPFKNKTLNTQDINNLERFLMLISIQSELEIEYKKKMTGLKILNTVFDSDKPFDKFLTSFSEEIFSFYLTELGIDVKKVNFSNLEDKLSFAKMLQLLIGRRAMKNDLYEEVFDQMLKVDLGFLDMTFDEFIHDQTQKSLTGKTLAEHNAIIRKQLQTKGINVNLALSYKKPTPFNYYGKASRDIQKLLGFIIENINKLLESIFDLQKTSDGDLSKLIKMPEDKKLTHDQLIKNFKKSLADDLINIRNLYNQITPSHKISKTEPLENIIPLLQDGFKFLSNESESLKKIQTESNLNLVNKIILHNNKIADFFNTTLENEHANAFNTAHHLLEKSVSELETENLPELRKTSFKNEQYTAEQWDKTKIDSYFLGNHLSCCLATDADKFPAMIQRRMDDAMMMHVIVDQKTGLPICGNWLFFAEDKNTGEIYVVANYFEIKQSVATDVKLKNELTKNLIEFTGQYTKDVGAKKFIMCHLPYGLISNFKHFPQAKVSIQKVGGYLALSDEVDAKASYFLLGADHTQFHEFTPEALLKEFPPPIPKNVGIFAHENISTLPPTVNPQPEKKH